MITNAAMKNGFTGGMIVDYPNSKKKKKYFLFLMAGFSEEIHAEAKSVIMPEALNSDNEDDDDEPGRYKKKTQEIGMFGTNKNKKTRNIYKK
jgi:18S rRNA (guanine1575-N7)-methyltransferase